MLEFWTNGAGMPPAFVQRAQRAEAAGFDGITIVDSQNLSGDCYIALAVAAAATTRIKLGSAYVHVVVHDDPETARRLGEGGLSLFARFSAMHGTAVGPSSAEEKRTFEGIHAAYDMTVHSRSHTPQAALLTSAFAREFGILGRPAHCIERLRALAALGIERFVVVGPSRDADRAEVGRAEQRFATEVMPALR